MAYNLGMPSETVRLWAIEHLVMWPNRFHVLLAGLLTILVVATGIAYGFYWFGILLVVVIDGSLALRVWQWDRQRAR